MLVLSRRVEDTIRFPELDITIEILKVKGASTRIGIDAPIEIRVLRGELETDPTLARKILVDADTEHDTSKKLDKLTNAAAFAKKLIQKGEYNLAAEKLEKTISEIGDSAPADRSLQALLVEDAENEREMLAGFLRLYGYDVTAVVDGVEAMEFLQSNEKPNLILIDMNMPRLDGPSTIQMIRSNVAFDDVEIFAISGQTAKAAKVDLSKNRVAHWFQKPLHPGDLVDAINSKCIPPTVANCSFPTTK